MTDTTREIELDVSTWRCPKCKSPLMAIPSGTTCPNQCIGIMLERMPAKIRRVNHAMILGVSVVTNRYGHYYLPDGSEVTLEKQCNRDISPKDLDHVAREGMKLWFIKKKSTGTDWAP